MKIQITKKNIIIDPAPRKTKRNGLVLYLSRDPIYNQQATDLPIVKTDLIKGQRKYTIPRGFVCTIKGISF
jgi:hypothetical protein